MAKAIALYTGGIHERWELAVREDGEVFSRNHINHPAYGRRCSAWRRFGARLGHNARANPPETWTVGFTTLHLARANGACINDRARFDESGSPRVRLPND